jgi:hypothetical protein
MKVCSYTVYCIHINFPTVFTVYAVNRQAPCNRRNPSISLCSFLLPRAELLMRVQSPESLALVDPSACWNSLTNCKAYTAPGNSWCIPCILVGQVRPTVVLTGLVCFIVVLTGRVCSMVVLTGLICSMEVLAGRLCTVYHSNLDDWFVPRQSL